MVIVNREGIASLIYLLQPPLGGRATDNREQQHQGWRGSSGTRTPEQLSAKHFIQSTSEQPGINRALSFSSP